MKRISPRVQRICLVTGISMTLLQALVWSPSVLAAEEVVLKYHIFRRTVPVEDLTTLAETGETSRRLGRYLRMANLDAERFREILNQQLPVEATTLDRFLESPAGDVVLDKIHEYAHTSSRDRNNRAMRTALVNSASDDNQISLVEVIQNYPDDELQVDADRLVSTYRDFEDIESQVSEVLQGDLLQGQFDRILEEIDLF